MCWIKLQREYANWLRRLKRSAEAAVKWHRGLYTKESRRRGRGKGKREGWGGWSEIRQEQGENKEEKKNERRKKRMNGRKENRSRIIVSGWGKKEYKNDKTVKGSGADFISGSIVHTSPKLNEVLPSWTFSQLIVINHKLSLLKKQWYSINIL